MSHVPRQLISVYSPQGGINYGARPYYNLANLRSPQPTHYNLATSRPLQPLEIKLHQTNSYKEYLEQQKLRKAQQKQPETKKKIKEAQITTNALIDLSEDKPRSKLFKKEHTKLNTTDSEIIDFISTYLNVEKMTNNGLYYCIIRFIYTGFSISKKSEYSYRVLFFKKNDNIISDMHSFKVNYCHNDKNKCIPNHILFTLETYGAIQSVYRDMKIFTDISNNKKYHSFNEVLNTAIVQPAIIKQYSGPQANQKAGYRRKKCGTKKKRFIKKY